MTPNIEKAQTIVQNIIENELELKLEPDKTKVTTFKDGFDFLGFTFSIHGATMRTKSVEKLKDKIKGITVRSHKSSSFNLIRPGKFLAPCLYDISST